MSHHQNYVPFSNGPLCKIPQSHYVPFSKRPFFKTSHCFRKMALLKKPLSQNVPFAKLPFRKMSRSQNSCFNKKTSLCEKLNVWYKLLCPTVPHWDVSNEPKLDRFERDILRKGHFANGTFWERDVLRTGRNLCDGTFWERGILQRGRFENGTFIKGTFCERDKGAFCEWDIMSPNRIF